MRAPIDSLLALVRPAPLPLDSATLSGDDWAGLLALATGHHLGALLHERLAPQLDTLPDDVASTLRAAHTASAASTLYFDFALQGLLDGFRQAEIPLVAYKGIPLARALYGDPSLRPAGDLDVMVRAADLERSRALLEREGWALQRSWEIHDIFIKEIGGTRVPLELHWVSQREGEYHIPEERLWEEARRFDEGWTFSNEMMLLIIILHSARHFFTPYRQLVDIAHAVALWNERLDWEKVRRLAAEAEALPILAVVLGLVHRDLGAPLPAHEPLARQLRAPRARLTQRYLSPWHLLVQPRFAALDRYLVPLLSGAWQPVRLLLHDLLPPPELVAYRYGIDPDSRLIPLYTLLRPLHLLGKHLRQRLPR